MYIFGYGSLINHHSRTRTGQTSEALPVTVEGIERHWGKIDSRYTISPLVARMGEGECNGVLMRVCDVALKQFDQREMGYQRIELAPEQIVTNHDFDKRQPIWVYVRSEHEPPCEVQPIMQTYVDTVLAGCLSISESFAEKFVQTTKGWHHPLENDRHQPKYGNHAGVEESHLDHIDRLLMRVRQT
ncbi:gamma-glutamylcyclotransferase [Photobacterium sanctipauli]|uniref:Gamma-glutamylcyclotransferase n=1 Tax=Photobacterium sanctipauli TaxID=1342794 RepID=A0A2T3NNP8_9GAMM|nr:gamma-glutamylcyclotransferase family protein [Photobacterium sanctipauli]PSW17614.1 gamma-glutamylcyclotransferase [Photobacterium sanctipauli]